MAVHRIITLLTVFIVGLSALPLAADEADAFFVDGTVAEIEIWFNDPNWYDTLFVSHASDPDDPYFPARFAYGDLVLDPVGVRFKGNSSFGIQGVKKSFKIDFNEYDEGVEDQDTTFFGLKKLNLNNGFKDPTLLRESLFLEFCAEHVKSLRSIHARVLVNGEYWGLYNAVEQVDSTFIESRFGDDEDGDLFEGEASGEGGPGSAFGSDLTYLGADPTAYAAYYQLKTNESADDWSDLIEFIDVLNNASATQLADRLEPIFDVDAWLYALAQDMLFVNLDSYIGSAHNYYLYDRDDSGRITYLHWDTNEAFGSFRYGMSPGQDARTLDLFWLPEAGNAPGSSERPLMERLLAVEKYRLCYLRIMAELLRDGFDQTTMAARINQLADLIRDDYYADPHKPYSNADFETALTSDTGGGQGQTYGLLSFVATRAAFLEEALDLYATPGDIRLNEIQSHNLNTVTDGSGDRDPWVEIYNLGPGRVALDQLSLTDDPERPNRWRLPLLELDDGRHLVLWLDGEESEGADHASFRLDSSGGTLYLYSWAGSSRELVDSVTYPALGNDESYIRLPDGEATWNRSDRPSPGTPNLGSSELPPILINELMADNDTTIQDPAGNGGYPDWIELYNPSDETIDLGGMYLSDSLENPTRWQIPSGVTIGGGQHLLIWADNDPDQGSTHASFKLEANGESVVLVDSDANGNRQIDVVTYPALDADVSYGRVRDGASEFVSLSRPTPGWANGNTVHDDAGHLTPVGG